MSRRKKEKLLGFRCDAGFHQLAQDTADEKDQTVSEFIRDITTKAIEKEQRKKARGEENDKHL